MPFFLYLLNTNNNVLFMNSILQFNISGTDEIVIKIITLYFIKYFFPQGLYIIYMTKIF